jgi:hypothetical protein
MNCQNLELKLLKLKGELMKKLLLKEENGKVDLEK